MNEELTRDYEISAQLLRILGHPVRLRIAAGLARECACVKDIWECLGMPQAVVSQHLKVMREHGVLEARREGARVCYSLREGAPAQVVRALF
ncbi:MULTISPECIES: ArsR/SmtB family transcription factor [Geobacter]|uniref:ArsR/SmtB family transcription factor n=1 Tax=Geobacter TaxID=28231 RepID=UPI000DBADD39|nr:metalloregulator ArsR/SmtB family transcription factor [Geobacter sulfurreducens]BBA68941.1 Biofilm growth-associated repressor [Geobacter sulfurreducens]BEH08739.1 metalloregulator ArsR/SmtB family transcription factor [Geobacter sulfurreducens subsp. ethanolicus]BET60226.1 metalloregulator ArsR/SmtB family transcription factor [Geobacter sp. 60473]HML77648.1 metalloregulator ArsR/SmtB family transcription factor [Geobacter sulfurreducens]